MEKCVLQMHMQKVSHSTVESRVHIQHIFYKMVTAMAVNVLKFSCIAYYQQQILTQFKKIAGKKFQLMHSQVALAKIMI